MIHPGEYPGAIQRTTTVNCPVVGGYVTARLRVSGEPLNSASGYVDNLTAVRLENVGNAAVSVRLQGVDDYSSGAREWVGAQQTLVPSGRVTYNVNPRHLHLEVKGMSGTSQLRMELSSRLRWNELGFDKADPFYPPFLFNARNPLTTAV